MTGAAQSFRLHVNGESESTESGSSRWAATVRCDHPSGIGNQVSSAVENPYGGRSPSHGIGTRQWSRPISA